MEKEIPKDVSAVNEGKSPAKGVMFKDWSKRAKQIIADIKKSEEITSEDLQVRINK